jgi:post-segregation antitoxin (ccd killing protein)
MPVSPAVGLSVERWARQRTSFRSGETREGSSRRIQMLVYAKFIYVCLYLSVSTTVISVRIRKELKRRARELGIDVREVVEKALEEAIRRREEEELVKALEELKSLFSRISEKEWVDAVRKSRDER